MDRKQLKRQYLNLPTTSKAQPIDIYKTNAQHALQITRWHLKLLGIWPLSPKSSIFEKIFTNVIIILCLFLLMFLLIPGILFIYVKVKDPLVRIKLAGALSFCAMALIKYYSLFLRRRDIASCIKHLVSDWEKVSSIEDRMIMINYAKLGRWGSVVCAIFMYSGGVFYAGILPCVSPTIKDENNITIKPIAYPSYYGLFDPQGYSYVRSLFQSLAESYGMKLKTFMSESQNCNQLKKERLLDKMDGIVLVKSRITNVLKSEKKPLQKLHNSSDSNAEYALQINRWLLKSLGVWPQSSNSCYNKIIFTKFIITMCSFSLAFVIVPGWFLTFVKIKSLSMRLEFIGVLSFCVMSIMKYYFMISQRHDIAQCIKYLVFDWQRITSARDQEIMTNYAQYGRFASMMCIIFIYGGGFFFTGILPLLTVTTDERNVTIRPLAYPSYYGYVDPQKSPAYEIIYTIHFFSTFVMLSITSGACSMAAVFVMHACGQLDILIAWLRNISHGSANHGERNEKLSMIIQQHVRTIKIEKLLCGVCLVEVVGSTMDICLLGYYILLEWSTKDVFRLITYALLLSSFISNIFIFCYIGECLTEKCNEVGTATYMIDWYRLSPKMGQSLILIIQIAQTPVFLTAGKLCNLSIFTFGTIFSTGHQNISNVPESSANVYDVKAAVDELFPLFTLYTRLTLSTTIIILPFEVDHKNITMGTMVMSDNTTSNTKNKSNEFKNISFDADARFALRINQLILQPLGIWPTTKESSLTGTVVSIILVIICSFLLAFIVLPGLFLLIKVKSAATKIRLGGPLSFGVMVVMKYQSLVSGQENLNDCIKQVVADWRELRTSHDRNIMISYAKYGRVGATICAFFMYGGGVFYAVILPHLSGNLKSSNNETIRPFAYPSYYGFFDPQLSPAYEIVFSLHCCCAFVMHSVTSATCSLAVVFVMHACGQLEIIIRWLGDLVGEKKNHGNLNERISMIIKKHVQTLKFICNVEKVLCVVCLIEVVGCTLNICTVGYDLLLQWGDNDAIGIITYTILLISFTFNIFLFCYIGERLTEQCKKVGETTYMIDWYRLPEKEALGLTLTIVTAQNPVIITAGKIVELSLNSFCTVMRTSVAYLNLLRTFMA
ncbi:hypothetical protein PV328_006811 [Microctonus aethiopoides]|uniref:Odorant receptor n=1 Tax=Microctonus aethiopoides TaxID=144406 RepID=A0AA39FQI5_9HYME|nr:hypothetical protein PV328_006811 [Microctonus aethiopoides]